MASVKLIQFKGKKLKNDSYPIMIQIIHDGKVRKISTGYSANEKEWDNSTKIFTKSKANNKWLNNFIHGERNKIEKTVLGLASEESDLTITDIMFVVKQELEKKTFFEYTQNIIDDLIKSRKVGNAAIYSTVLNVVKSFTHEVDFSFKDMNYKWLNQFEVFHLNKGNSINGLNVYFRTIRAIYNKAIKEGYAKQEHYPFKDFKLKLNKTKKRAISKDAIEKIKDLELIPETEIWNAKNYFLFSFYTRGMNWVDMAKLKLSNIIDGRIRYKRSKNGKEFSIKLNDGIKEILDCYIVGKENNDFVFPIIKRADNSVLLFKDIKNGLKNFNKYLNRIGQQCGIDTKLTSYVSRHSWGTIGYKEHNIPVGIISQGYGHEDIKTTQIYLEDFDDEALDNANDMITQ